MTIDDHIESIKKHLAHAKEKHQHFADKAFCPDTIENCKWNLADCRKVLAKEIAVGNVYAEDLLLEEIWEAAEAFADRDSGKAVEEIYDAVAVLLRMAERIAERGCE